MIDSKYVALRGNVAPDEWAVLDEVFAVPDGVSIGSFRVGIADESCGGVITVADAFAGIVPEEWQRGDPVPHTLQNLIPNPDFTIEQGHARPVSWWLDVGHMGRIAPSPEGLTIQGSDVVFYTAFPVQPGRKLLLFLRVKSTRPSRNSVRLWADWTDKSAQTQRWSKHHVKRAGENAIKHNLADYRILKHPSGGMLLPFSMARMDNGELILLCSWSPLTLGGDERAVAAFSKDNGDTWAGFQDLPGAFNRPVGIAYLGKGNIMTELGLGKRYFSSDYGRTWPEQLPAQLPSNGGFWAGEGSMMVDYDESGAATRIAEIGFNYLSPAEWPKNPGFCFLRWSYDGGRTWVEESQPSAWRLRVEYEGETYTTSAGEGAIIRAQNGWLVAILRTTPHPRTFETRHDHLCGLGASVSKDDGKTWSPIQMLYDAGRTHTHLVLMTNGDIVGVNILRQDYEDGRLISYRRGCEAFVSHDNGLTWDITHKYVLDEWEFTDGAKWTNACGHTCSAPLDDGRILSAYGHYPSAGAVTVRWKP